MPNGFITVPDWFSFENQGAGRRWADLSGGGLSDLVVLMVDNPPGQNRGSIGSASGIAEDGTAAGGWTDWTEVPDWFSFENQGAGMAVADLDGDGRPELIVFMIDNPAGQNQGFYRVGRKLDARRRRHRRLGRLDRRSRTGSPSRTSTAAWRWPTSTATAGPS